MFQVRDFEMTKKKNEKKTIPTICESVDRSTPITVRQWYRRQSKAETITPKMRLNCLQNK